MSTSFLNIKKESELKRTVKGYNISMNAYSHSDNQYTLTTSVSYDVAFTHFAFAVNNLFGETFYSYIRNRVISMYSIRDIYISDYKNW